MAFVVRREPDRTVAEDVLADTYLVAWRRSVDIPAEEDAARAWLCGVARRVLANDRRARARLNRVVERLTHEEVARPSRWATPFAADRLIVAAAWLELTDADRQLLCLVVAGRTPTELADLLGCSPGAVMTRVSRARRQLNAAMAQ
jgi:RNA polymerase sigma-70 factor (ECF subfamily)